MSKKPKQIGHFWIKQLQGTNESCLCGEIRIGLIHLKNIRIFKNKYKKRSEHPDMKAYLFNTDKDVIQKGN